MPWRVLEQHGVVAEGHPQLADRRDRGRRGTRRTAAAPCPGRCRHDERVAGVLAQDALQALDPQLVERRRRQPQPQRRRGTVASSPARTVMSGRSARTVTRPGLSRRPLTVTIRSSSSLWPCSVSVRGNTVTSIVAVEVLQHEHRHLVALLGELAGQVGDHAADHAPGRRRRDHRLGDRCCRPCA